MCLCNVQCTKLTSSMKVTKSGERENNLVKFVKCIEEIRLLLSRDFYFETSELLGELVMYNQTFSGITS